MGSRPANSQVQVAATAGFLEALAESGCDSNAILRGVGLSREDLDDPDNAIALAQFIGLLDLGAHHSGDRCFGLHLGTRLDPADLGVLGFVALNSSDIGRAILNVGRYISVMKDQCRVILEVEGATARVRYRLSTMSPRARRQDSDLAMSRMQSFIRRIMGPHWTPQEVQLEHSPPGDRAPYERVFRAPVRFGAPHNAMIFDHEVLEAVIASADNRLLRILERVLVEQVERRQSDSDLMQRVRRLVAEQLSHAGAPAILEVADKVGMSVRTLQRRLGEHGWTYNRLVDELRYDLALEYLEEDSLSISEIAFLLGYSEISAFDRAFRRRSHLSPLAFRRQLRTG